MAEPTRCGNRRGETVVEREVIKENDQLLALELGGWQCLSRRQGEQDMNPV